MILRPLNKPESSNHKLRIFFIYPTPFKVSGLPVGVAVLNAVMKEDGHLTRIFDTAFYDFNKEPDQTKKRAEREMSKEVKNEDLYLTENTTDLVEDLLSAIAEFRPHLVSFSVLETMYDTSLLLSQRIKEKFPEISIIMGGVHPTFFPDLVIAQSSVDIVCVGEGETPLRELAQRIIRKQPFNDIEGLWTKKDGEIHRMPPAKIHDINILPFPDYRGFDPRLFYKPMQGKMYKMISIESSRGCINNCTYCAAPQLRKLFKKHNCGNYTRNMTMDRVIEQIKVQIKRHNPEFLFFSSENFLQMSDDEFRKFIEAYKEIRLPFWIQTRVETITKEKIAELKKVGLFWLTLGLEHGNEEFRRKILKRHYSNDMFLKKIEIINEADMGASINNIIGFPGENRELIFETIRMNKKLYERNRQIESNVCIFVPFGGSELYSVCKEKGLLKDVPSIAKTSQEDRSVLQFPNGFGDTIRGIVRTFNLYVKLPESCWDKIRIAETPSEEGEAMFRQLKEELHKNEEN
jgi:radical SAM superfamily enzyme YgiQ (UPF0313 family)